MCGGLKKRYILTAVVCFGAVMSGGCFAQAESTTTESRSETRTTGDRNGTIAERVRRTESRTTVSSETKDSDAIRNMAAEQRRQMERMGLPHTGNREFNEKVEYQYDDVNRIYFQYEVLNSLGNKVSLDSVVFSFEKATELAQICLKRFFIRKMAHFKNQKWFFCKQLLQFLWKYFCKK